MRLYFVRHGQSEANILREFSNTGTKHPLTGLGVEQAHQLAGVLASHGIGRIFSSPVLRARQTAAILSERLGVGPVEVTEALREWSVGILEGTRAEEGWQMHDKVQVDWFEHKLLDHKIPEGESWNEIYGRFMPLIERLVQAGQNSDERVVLVGHGGLYIAMLPAILQNVDYPYARAHGFPNTGYALAETRGNELICVEWCGEPFIKEG